MRLCTPTIFFYFLLKGFRSIYFFFAYFIFLAAIFVSLSFVLRFFLFIFLIREAQESSVYKL